MSTLRLEEIVASVPALELKDLKTLRMAVDVAIGIRSQGEVTGEPVSVSSDDGPGLSDQALAILGDEETFSLTLADQALLASLVLADTYRQDIFSSRDINDIVEESGRSRFTHVTSVVTSLLDKGYLSGTTKSSSLSREGRAKARALVGMVRRRAAVDA